MGHGDGQTANAFHLRSEAAAARRPTYGQTNFDFMFEFLYYQIQEQQRPVGFYPETAYWVNYDNEASAAPALSRRALARARAHLL